VEWPLSSNKRHFSTYPIIPNAVYPIVVITIRRPTMTEYELFDAVGTFHGLAISTLMAYFSILSAYLLVGYLTGPNLSRQQTILITGLYLVMQLFMVWGAVSYFRLGAHFAEQAGSMPSGIIVSFVKPHQIALFLLIFGVIAGLKFMWDVRHPKTE
jgi:hypothetical protein